MVATEQLEGNWFEEAWMAWAVNTRFALAPWNSLPNDVGTTTVSLHMTAGESRVKINFGVVPWYQAVNSLATLQHVNDRGHDPPDWP